jgi:hypothetical protein
MSTNKVLISYRRADGGYAGRIFDYIDHSFPGQISKDLTELPLGTDFRTMIKKEVGRCQAVLAVIGPNWRTTTDYGSRRIDSPDDYVRVEIATALLNNIPVIPLLVGGEQMPSEESLPPAIAQLATRNALEISETNFYRDMERLVLALESVLKTKAVSKQAGKGQQDRSEFAESTKQTHDDRFSDDVGLVFVCYAREDQDFALRLAKTVKERGVRVWVDQWDIPASADWDHSIDEALFSCDRFLIVLSQSAVGSNEVRTELRTAIDEKKCIVPVLLQQCRIPRALRLTQHIDFISAAPDDEKRIGQLLRALKLPK